MQTDERGLRFRTSGVNIGDGNTLGSIKEGPTSLLSEGWSWGRRRHLGPRGSGCVGSRFILRLYWSTESINFKWSNLWNKT